MSACPQAALSPAKWSVSPATGAAADVARLVAEPVRVCWVASAWRPAGHRTLAMSKVYAGLDGFAQSQDELLLLRSSSPLDQLMLCGQRRWPVCHCKGSPNMQTWQAV